jgi:hypothetical protein
MGLVVPSQLMNALNNAGNNNNNNNNNNNSTATDIPFLNGPLEMPQAVGSPTYDPSTKTVSFTFSFTSPFKQEYTIDTAQAGIVASDGTFLGNLAISQPLNLVPGQTVDITALGILSDDAVNYFQTHQGSVNINLTNAHIEVSGLSITLDSINIGDIPIPPGIFG